VGFERRRHAVRHRAADEDDMAQVAGFLQDGQQQGEALGRSHQDTRAAVAQDVCNLFRLEQRVERDEHRTGRAAAEAGNHELAALLQVDRHPLRALRAAAGESAGKVFNVGVQGGEVQTRFLVSDCGRARVTLGAVLDELVQQIRRHVEGAGVGRWFESL
jgi:hypothetical protein